MPPARFDYLPLVMRRKGPTRVPPAVVSEDPTTANNKAANRATHSGNRKSNAKSISANWITQQALRKATGAPETNVGVPLLLKVDPSVKLDDLRNQFSFEIVSEEEDGFVIVASEEIELITFEAKLNDFAAASGASNVAKIHELRADLSQSERLEKILSERLLADWATMRDDDLYMCNVSVTCLGTWDIPKKPKKNPRWKAETWAKKENGWSTKRLEAYEKWESLKDQRLESIERLVEFYKGRITLNIDNATVESVDLPDSFTLRIEVSTKGLKDIVFNAPYIFEVAEPEDTETPQGVMRALRTLASEIQLTRPSSDAPAVCIIDTGIQEEHVLIEPAMDKDSYRCFLPNHSSTDVADYVQPSGHGTRVAGAVLHGSSAQQSDAQQSEFWIQNARVLNDRGVMPRAMIPAIVMRDVVDHFHKGHDTRIFNESINVRTPCRTRYSAS